MSSIILKYRPSKFSDLVGNSAIKTMLTNQLAQNKVANYLFIGSSGNGKTTTARILAKALNCEREEVEIESPCLICDSCCLDPHPDVIELDAASHSGVNEIRESVIKTVKFTPTQGKYKIYILDEVQMLSKSAQSALLKIIEEPPSHVKFIFCTTDPDKILDTIRSRCQILEFKTPTDLEMARFIEKVVNAEGGKIDENAALYLVDREKGMRNLLSTIGSSLAFNSEITLEWLRKYYGDLSTQSLDLLLNEVKSGNFIGVVNKLADIKTQVSSPAHFWNSFAKHTIDAFETKILTEGNLNDGVLLSICGDLGRHWISATSSWAYVEATLFGLVKGIQESYIYNDTWLKKVVGHLGGEKKTWVYEGTFYFKLKEDYFAVLLHRTQEAPYAKYSILHRDIPKILEESPPDMNLLYKKGYIFKEKK